MHPSSMENMKRCIDLYKPKTSMTVIDLGASAVNGSYRELFEEKDNYTGIDLEDGPGVDLVLEDPYHLPLSDGSVDLVISGQMLEHCEQFWRTFSEISRVLTPGGIAFIIAPSSGPIHRYPVDCYRFYPDSFQALADWCNLRLVHWWLDERGPWRDLVGVYEKGDSLSKATEPPVRESADPAFETASDDVIEKISGARHYLDVLADLHSHLKPELYLEIGIRKGASLRLGECEAIGIDPSPDLTNLEQNATIFNCTSDDFFFFHEDELSGRKIDLALIDGMHLAEFAYRDFMHLEKFMSPAGLVVIDDVLPNHPLQAERDRKSRVWCGDVWRFAELLAETRPDLQLTWLDASPAGLLLISNLDPTNRVLWDNYNPLMRKLDGERSRSLPEHILERKLAVDPAIETLKAAVRAQG
jgi:SAM-dependent methyltransferase